MPGKRDSAAWLFGTLGLSRVAGAARSAAVRDLRVLAYHRVLPQLEEDRFAFDPELVSALQGEFEWQMAYVARHFQPVSCQQVVDALHAGHSLPRRAVMVTFDDGFLDNHEVAFPVLRRLGVPALFFLSTGYIGGQAQFWFDRLVHLILCTTTARVELDVLQMTLVLPPSREHRLALAMQVLKRLKRATDADRMHVLSQLESGMDCGGAPAGDGLNLPMDWAHVREMAQSGMEFGSHTVTHPVLSKIVDPAHLRNELEASKAMIEQHTGRPVVALAYPVGGPDAISASVLAATRQAGYRIAFTYQSGANRLATAQPLLLKRLHVERYTRRHEFEAALQWPEVFAPRH